MLEYPVNSLSNILRDVIRSHFVLSQRFLSHARQYQDSLRARVDARLDVAWSIANHETARQIQSVLGGRFPQEFGFRFPAVAVVFGMMRTDVVPGKPDAGRCKLFVQVRVNLLDCFTVKVAYAADGVCLV